MVDYGDYVPNQPGWSQAAVYHVSWEAAPACPMPEIYNSVNAAEWQSLNLYALGAGLPQLGFIGVLSEDGADGGLSSSDSWNRLRSATGQAASYVSVIGSTGPVPPVPVARLSPLLVELVGTCVGRRRGSDGLHGDRLRGLENRSAGDPQRLPSSGGCGVRGPGRRHLVQVLRQRGQQSRIWTSVPAVRRRRAERALAGAVK